MDNTKISKNKVSSFPINKWYTVGFFVMIIYIIYEFSEGDTDYKAAIWAAMAACNLISLGLYFNINKRIRELEKRNYSNDRD